MMLASSDDLFVRNVIVLFSELIRTKKLNEQWEVFVGVLFDCSCKIRNLKKLSRNNW